MNEAEWHSAENNWWKSLLFNESVNGCAVMLSPRTRDNNNPKDSWVYIQTDPYEGSVND